MFRRKWLYRCDDKRMFHQWGEKEEAGGLGRGLYRTRMCLFCGGRKVV